MMRTEIAAMRWNEMLAEKNVNDMWKEIRNVLNEMMLYILYIVC